MDANENQHSDDTIEPWVELPDGSWAAPQVAALLGYPRLRAPVQPDPGQESP